MKNAAMYCALTGATSLSDVPVPGQITAINASMNFAASMAQDVTGYIAGLPATDEEQLLDELFPAVETNDFFQFPVADDEFFLTDADGSDIRALGAGFKKIQFRGSVMTAATQQKGLTMPVEHRTLPKRDGKVVPGWENRYAAHLKARLIRAELVRGFTLLDAGAVNVNKVWNAASNPDGDMRDQVQATRRGSGQLPTHLILGNAAQQLRQDAYEASTRANHEMANHADYTMEELARYLGVKKVIVDDGIKQLKRGAAKADRTGLATYSYSAEKGAMLEDPSNIKRAWNNTFAGGKWAVSIKPGVVTTEITVYHESLIFIPITTGIQKLTVSAA